MIKVLAAYVIGIPLAFGALGRIHDGDDEYSTRFIFFMSVLWPLTLLSILGYTALAMIDGN